MSDHRALPNSPEPVHCDPNHTALLQWNALSQISTWFPGTEGSPPSPVSGLNDYANKQYAGITVDYHLQRYIAYSSVKADAIRAGNAPNKTRFVELLTPVAFAFTSGATGPYSPEPVGDVIAVASEMFARYAAQFVEPGCGQ